MIAVNDAEALYHKARNHTFINELYLTDESIEALDAVFEVLWDWIVVAQNPGEGFRRNYEREELMDALETVHTVLRADLQSDTVTAAP